MLGLYPEYIARYKCNDFSECQLDHYKCINKKIYCSELIFKGFKSVYKEELGKVVKLGDLDWKPYELIIRQIDPTLPLARKMITPKHMSEADQLIQVYKSIEQSSHLGVKP